MVFFDLDGTLVDSKLNNTFIFIAGYYASRDMQGRLLLQWAWKACARLGFRDEGERRRWLIGKLFSGISYDDLAHYAKTEYQQNVDARRNEEIYAILGAHQDAGDMTVMVTACTEIPARCIAASWGVDTCVCTTFSTNDGIITGVGTDTYGVGKLSALAAAGYDNQALSSGIYYVDEPERERDVIAAMGSARIVSDGRLTPPT